MNVEMVSRIAALEDRHGLAMRAAFAAVSAIEDARWSRIGHVGSRSNGLDHVYAALENVNEQGDMASLMDAVARCHAIAAAMTYVASVLDDVIQPALPELRARLLDGAA